MGEYYDGTKLLSLNDINGNKPEIYICTTNRTGGKTTYFSRMLVNRFNKYGDKFMLIYRFNYELNEVADKFYKDIGSLFFPTTQMTSKSKAKGIFHELYIDNVPCGYAIALNNADQLKKYSHLFSDVKSMYMDEFQSETNHYCPDEVKKFISVHTSVARGHGQQVRYVPVYLIGNPVTILNPYYIALDVATKLDGKTRYLKGNGFVIEQGYVESASKAQQNSSFMKAFSNDNYVAYSTQGVYLNDNLSFIEHIEGRSKYLLTLKYNGCEYAVREYAELGIVYCDNRPDKSFKYKISVTTNDHNINYVMLKSNDIFLINLRYYFEHGCFRFRDLKCKEAILKALSY